LTRYTLHPANETDKEQIRHLSERCYRDVVERQFGAWDIEAQRQFFEKKWATLTYQKVLIGGQFGGALAIDRGADQITVSEILIAPEFQGQRIGTEIVLDVLKSAAAGQLPIKLQVLHQNRAMSLYKRLGFVETGRNETHVLMECAISRSS
jgi:ribosomal protein S18 acetylase RimI-like enzyme